MKEDGKEKWLPVLSLCRRDGKWNIVRWYSFPVGKYYVSDKGRFMSNGRIKDAKPDNVGTKTFQLNKERFKLHEIVMQTFEPNMNIDGYTPDHIDRNNRLDNSLENLRWADKATQCRNRENIAYKLKRVVCFNNGAIYQSCQEAERVLGLPHNTVSSVARGVKKSIRGYRFTFAEKSNANGQKQLQLFAL